MIHPEAATELAEHAAIVRRLEKEAGEARLLLNRWIVQAYDDGATVRELGEIVGLHYTRIGQIVRESAEAAATAARVANRFPGE